METPITEDDLPRTAEDDLPGIARTRKITYRGLAKSGLRQAGIGQASVSHLPRFGGAGKSSL
jgi:hypothetical protein